MTRVHLLSPHTSAESEALEGAKEELWTPTQQKDNPRAHQRYHKCRTALRCHLHDNEYMNFFLWECGRCIIGKSEQQQRRCRSYETISFIFSISVSHFTAFLAVVKVADSNRYEVWSYLLQRRMIHPKNESREWIIRKVVPDAMITTKTFQRLKMFTFQLIFFFIYSNYNPPNCHWGGKKCLQMATIHSRAEDKIKRWNVIFSVLNHFSCCHF